MYDTCSQEVEVQPETSKATGISLKIIREILQKIVGLNQGQPDVVELRGRVP
jgi:hypothetical protein